MHNSEEIKSKIEELMSNTPGIVSVGYGYKTKNGVMTNDLSFVYSVQEKKPLSELTPEEIIPSEVNMTTGKIKTDVRVIHNVKALACNATCGQMAGSNSAFNRSVVRPIRGGLSMTSTNTISTVGTLGFIGVHTDTQTLVGVTNNHVTIQDAFYTSERNPSGDIKNEYSSVNNIYQNGENGYIPPSNYLIGQSLRYVPIHEDDGITVNYADAAFFSVKSEDIDNTISIQQAGVSYTSYLPFATTSEIDNLLTTNPMLYSSGRTTGPKGGASCPIRVSLVNALTYIQYHRQGTYTTTLFGGCIEFVKPVADPDISTICSNPIIAGDSGSALIADFGGVRKIIGLVFAGADIGGTTYYGYACRIDKVAQELGIEAWDGTSKNFVNPASIYYITTPLGSNDKVISCGGRDYWQVGFTNDSNPC